jgi:hypothetical protein
VLQRLAATGEGPLFTAGRGSYREGIELLPLQLQGGPMILSHQHKLIFLKPQKVAGTSFEIALSKYMTDGDIVTPISRDDEALRRRLGFTGPQNFNFALVKLVLKDPNGLFKPFGYDLPAKFYNHMPAKLVKWHVPSSVWRDYRKLSLVRNPWERAISIFFWRNTRKGQKPDLASFTRYFQENQRFLVTNYGHYLVGGECVIDDFIRYEDFEADISKFEREMPAFAGLWQTFQGINAKGETRNRALTRQQIFADHPDVNAMIEKLNAWEIERFGYRL